MTPLWADTLIELAKNEAGLVITGHFCIDFNRRAGQKTPFYLDALICEPDFAAKLKSGAQDGSKCLACNGCCTIYRKCFVRCVQHQDEIEQFKTIPW